MSSDKPMDEGGDRSWMCISDLHHIHSLSLSLSLAVDSIMELKATCALLLLVLCVAIVSSTEGQKPSQSDTTSLYDQCVFICCYSRESVRHLEERDACDRVPLNMKLLWWIEWNGSCYWFQLEILVSCYVFQTRAPTRWPLWEYKTCNVLFTFRPLSYKTRLAFVRSL